ncbi:MAG TPA: alkaline phosphatase family protein [Actinomycetes bacterium]
MARPRPPLYNKASFVRHLDANRVSWRWYCFDPGTLRLADAHYLLGHLRRFAYFSKSGLPWASRLDLSVNARVGSFVEDAANGALPSVSWIDPAFTNFSPLGFPVNDDHPPADVRDGQDLVLAVYDALASGPNWDSSLLIVVYDEHGGFYDHVPPPSAVDDDPAMFGSYGVRVPAMVVSPWVEPASVTGTLLDHTSIIKTILLRFCPRALDPQPEPAGKPRRSRMGPPSAWVRAWRGPTTSASSSPGPLRGCPRRATPCSATRQHGTGKRPHRTARETVRSPSCRSPSWLQRAS